MGKAHGIFVAGLQWKLQFVLGIFL